MDKYICVESNSYGYVGFGPTLSDAFSNYISNGGNDPYEDLSFFEIREIKTRLLIQEIKE